MVSSDHFAMIAVVDSCPELPAPSLVSVTYDTIDFPGGVLGPFVYRRIIVGGLYWWVPEQTLIGVPGDQETRRFKSGDQITFWDKVGLACPTIGDWEAIVASLAAGKAPTDYGCFDGSAGEITRMIVLSEPRILSGPPSSSPTEFALVEIEVTGVFRSGYGRASVGDRYWINAFAAQRETD